LGVLEDKLTLQGDLFALETEQYLLNLTVYIRQHSTGVKCSDTLDNFGLDLLTTLSQSQQKAVYARLIPPLSFVEIRQEFPNELNVDISVSCRPELFGYPANLAEPFLHFLRGEADVEKDQSRPQLSRGDA
jgi:hypothetical protein